MPLSLPLLCHKHVQLSPQINIEKRNIPLNLLFTAHDFRTCEETCVSEEMANLLSLYIHESNRFQLLNNTLSIYTHMRLG